MTIDPVADALARATFTITNDGTGPRLAIRLTGTGPVHDRAIAEGLAAATFTVTDDTAVIHLPG